MRKRGILVLVRIELTRNKLYLKATGGVGSQRYCRYRVDSKLTPVFRDGFHITSVTFKPLHRGLFLSEQEPRFTCWQEGLDGQLM